MTRTVPLSVALAAVGIVLPAAAADLSVVVDLPRLDVAEYHRPYVAIWIEKPDQSFVANLAVWYDLNKKAREGTKWLKDLRAWWRKSGRDLDMPVDGLSSATRAAGSHTLAFGGKAPVAALPPGDYQLVVEAARESGGRELLRVPFQWPPKEEGGAKASGEHELAAIAVITKP